MRDVLRKLGPGGDEAAVPAPEPYPWLVLAGLLVTARARRAPGACGRARDAPGRRLAPRRPSCCWPRPSCCICCCSNGPGSSWRRRCSSGSARVRSIPRHPMRDGAFAAGVSVSACVALRARSAAVAAGRRAGRLAVTRRAHDRAAARRLRQRALVGAPAVGAGRRHAGHGGRRAAGHRPRADGGAAAADHVQPRSDERLHHVRRHLLRRDVRRLHHQHPAQHAGRDRVDRHGHRRLRDGAPGARGRGAHDGGDRIVRRRHAGDLALTFFSPLLASVALRFGPAEYFALSMLAFTTVASLLGGVARARAVQPVPRPRARPHRHRSAHRRRALLLRHPATARRHRRADPRHRPVRRRRDAATRRGGTGARRPRRLRCSSSPA